MDFAADGKIYSAATSSISGQPDEWCVYFKIPNTSMTIAYNTSTGMVWFKVGSGSWKTVVTASYGYGESIDDSRLKAAVLASANSVADKNPFTGNDGEYCNWFGFKRGASGIAAIVVGFDGTVNLYCKNSSGEHLHRLIKL